MRHVATTTTNRNCIRRPSALEGEGLTHVTMRGGYGPHSTHGSAVLQAARIELLWWLFFWVCVVVWVLVMAFLLVPVFRRRRGALPAVAADAPDIRPEPAGERRRTIVVGGAVGVTVLVLFVLLV